MIIFLVSIKGLTNLVQVLLSYKADINIEDIYKRTPLHWSIYSNLVD